MKIHNILFMPPGNPDSPFCQALVNQDVMIGSDEVGYACRNKASKELAIADQRYAVCDECNNWIVDQLRPESVSVASQVV